VINKLSKTFKIRGEPALSAKRHGQYSVVSPDFTCATVHEVNKIILN